MKNSKITKFLPIALAMSLTIGAAHADIAKVSATAQTLNYSLDLKDYAQITTKTSQTTANGTYDANYTGLTLTSDMTANFEVITNQPRTVVLSSTPSVTGATTGLYGYDSNNHTFYLVFAKDGAAESDAIDAIVGAAPGSAKVAESPNAFGVRFDKVNVSAVHNEGDDGDAPADITGVQQEGKGDITFTIPNGVSTLSFKSYKIIQNDTFNTRDTNGTYKAKLTLTDGAPI